MAYTRAVGAMWRWAMGEDPPMASNDIAAGMPVTPKRPAEIKFLPVNEVSRILAGVGPHRPAAALMLFAGVRPHEVAGADKPRLLWSHVNVAERTIRIPGEIAKTGVPRIVEGLPGALWRWIGPPGRPQDPISRTLAPVVIEKAAAAAGYGERCQRVRKWPHDALRHSFATYAMALTADPGRVSVWLGHEGKPALLYRNYRGLATKAEAEAFWGL
jgi:integrase